MAPKKHPNKPLSPKERAFRQQCREELQKFMLSEPTKSVSDPDFDPPFRYKLAMNRFFRAFVTYEDILYPEIDTRWERFRGTMVRIFRLHKLFGTKIL